MQDAVMQLNVPLCLRREGWDGRSLVEGWNSARAHEYLLALQRELAANADEFADVRIAAVRWGGGLASMANAQDISDTMRLVCERYAVAEGAPVTLEASISNISGASMPFFKRAGITRFDFEMMQLTPMAFSRVNSTDRLGDLDLVADYFLKAYATNLLGMVLLYGFGAADPNGFRQSITAFLCSKASHLRLVRAEGPDALDDEAAEAQLAAAAVRLEEAGFRQYVPLHFARPGKEDRFALLTGGRYGESGVADRRQAAALEVPVLAFGLRAQTIADAVLASNTGDFGSYCAWADDFARITESVVPLATEG